jgi:hypothetical protein
MLPCESGSGVTRLLLELRSGEETALQPLTFRSACPWNTGWVDVGGIELGRST